MSDLAFKIIYLNGTTLVAVLDPEGGSQNATVVVVLAVGISVQKSLRLS